MKIQTDLNFSVYNFPDALEFFVDSLYPFWWIYFLFSLGQNKLLCFWPPLFIFCYSRPNTKHIWLKDPNSNSTYIQQKPSFFQNICTKKFNTMGNSFLCEYKVIKTNTLKQENVIFWELKHLYTKDKITSHMSWHWSVHIPDQGLITFQIFEQK